MANQQPERFYQPLVRKPPDPLLSFYCFRETIETSPWWTSEPSSEEGGVRQRNRSREDAEEGQTPTKRLRTSYGKQPPHVEAVGKAEDSGPSSSAGVERSDHGSARITSSSRTCMMTYSTADFEALYEELERLGQGGFGSVFAGYRREDRLPVRVTPQNHTPCASTHVSDPLEAEDSSEAREDSEVPGSSFGSRDTDRSGSRPSSSAGVEHSDHSSARITSSCRIRLTTYSTADFEALYEELERLGQGGFGSVFAGCRRQDRLPVAIKHIPMDMVVMTRVTLHGQLTDCPLEVSLMLRAAEDQPDPEGPGAVVLLLDWFQLDQELILVQERPDASVDLRAYMRSKGSKLQEQEAKMIVHQVVEGVQGLHSRGVLHRDIKPENLLVETGSDTPRVRIIDLGCGCLHNNEVYLEFDGTDSHIPPEWYARGAYRADPMTVWQVGVLLYEMLTGHVPFQTSTEIIWKKLPRIESDMSPNCKDFLKRCLTKRALGRPLLQSLLLHPWLRGARRL
ncbi:unnamed protein product [Arctogadus glacialis]